MASSKKLVGDVKDATLAAEEATTRPEHVPSRKPADKHGGVRNRDVEPLPVHLFMGDLKVRPDPVYNRVPRLHHPEPFLLAGFPPSKEA